MSNQVILTEYQHLAIETFLRALPGTVRTIVELGSDVEAKVVRTLAARTSTKIYGLNPSPEFPRLVTGLVLPERVVLLREDGRRIPLPDSSVDAVFTVATIEHVIGLDLCYAEISRILKPGGTLHADFGPIWSGAQGHHTFAVIEDKEARYWKTGRNPVPDFYHLLLDQDQMRDFLREGPCDSRLVEPIVRWIYIESGINRCFLEEHLAALKQSRMLMQRLKLKPGIIPDADVWERLREKWGERNYTASGVEATLRKPTGNLSFVLLTKIKRIVEKFKILLTGNMRSWYHAARQFEFMRHRLEKLRKRMR
jgi:SAM-dependent methyltransferase